MRTITIITLLIAFIGMTFFTINLLNNEKAGYMDSRSLNYVSTSGNKAELLEQAFIINILNGNTYINDITLHNLNKDSISFNLLVLNGPVLFIRFSEMHCSECVHFILNKARRLSKEYGFEDKVILLASYLEVRNLKLLIKEMQLSFPVYIVDQLDIPCEEAGYPYCFISDKSLRAHQVFIPDKSEPKLSNLYFKLLQMKYFKQNHNKE